MSNRSNKKIIWVSAALVLAAGLLLVGFFFREAILSGRTIKIIPSQEEKETIFQGEAEKEELELPSLSGWIAWWKEKEGFETAEKYSEKLKQISPTWLKLNKNQKLVETGKMNKNVLSQKIKEWNFEFYPLLATDMTDKELAKFIRNEDKLNSFVEDIIEKLKEYSANGLDLDFENISAEYEDEFSKLIKILDKRLEVNDLKFVVTVQAQTGKDDWKGLTGQNLELIGKYADEVRVMVYDRHGDFSHPGPVTPSGWYQDVLNYNLKKIPPSKIVIGLPTYGYIWNKDGSVSSYQYQDFISQAEKTKMKPWRDPESHEIKYENSQSIGWLSDAEAVIRKINYAREKNLNKFIIWSLGGTDEALFQIQWK